MRHGAWRWIALISITIMTVLPADGGQRPFYGGDLRVRTSGQLTRLEPASSPTTATDFALRLRLLPLVFEGLVKLNEQGRPEPLLAIAWNSSADFRRWNFTVRPGARFHDGSPVTASVLVDCLTTVENPFIVHEYEGKIVFESADPMPDLPAVLAMPDRAISRPTSKGATVGTGPFRIGEWEAGRRAVLVAFEDHWGGRPFVDRIFLEMAQPPKNQWMDLELGRADVIEIPVEEVRNTTQRGYRMLMSRPLELMALFFSSPPSSPHDLDLRRALALAIDRDAILRVLLQRQGEAAGSLLPQWISGYGFLFDVVRDVTRARSLLPAPGQVPEFSVGYRAADRLARSIAERLALDVQAVGIRLHPVPVQDPPLDSVTPAVMLVRVPIAIVDEKQALAGLASHLGLRLPEQTDWSQPESVFKAERELLKDVRLIPLFHLPVCYAVGQRVRYQRPEDIFLTQPLHLESVWVENQVQASIRLDSISGAQFLAMLSFGVRWPCHRTPKKRGTPPTNRRRHEFPHASSSHHRNGGRCCLHGSHLDPTCHYNSCV
ncbi:MAG: ABC transporter substrate-binding protein [Acidobacteria bacterium]|nr:MAG: ABC transporter substrate-binding protein [Acidobacteriota bacterium]